MSLSLSRSTAVLVIVLAIAGAIVVLQVSDQPFLSPIDELQHFDSAPMAPSARVLIAEQCGVEAIETVACRNND